MQWKAVLVAPAQGCMGSAPHSPQEFEKIPSDQKHFPENRFPRKYGKGWRVGEVENELTPPHGTRDGCRPAPRTTHWVSGISAACPCLSSGLCPPKDHALEGILHHSCKVAKQH